MDLNHNKILIVKPSSLGDIIHTLPLVHALKRCYPDCRIGWIVQEAFASIPESDPTVDTVYRIKISSTSDPQSGRLAYLHAFLETIRTLAKLRKIFRQEPYDQILDLHASFRSGLLGLTNPGGIRIGFADAKELNPLFQKRRVSVTSGVTHAIDKNLLFCTTLNCIPREQDFMLHSSENDNKHVEAFLHGEGVTSADRLVYMNAAARWKTKYWNWEKWVELADHLTEENGFKVVFAGSEKDRPYISTIADKMIHPPVVAAGKLSLSESVSLLRRSSVYVGLDSGPMHMAAMAGIPVVVLFGPTNPERVGPYGEGHKVIRADNVDCLGCRKRDCGHMTCMNEISVEKVYTAVSTLLGNHSTGRG